MLFLFNIIQCFLRPPSIIYIFHSVHLHVLYAFYAFLHRRIPPRRKCIKIRSLYKYNVALEINSVPFCVAGLSRRCIYISNQANERGRNNFHRNQFQNVHCRRPSRRRRAESWQIRLALCERSRVNWWYTRRSRYVDGGLRDSAVFYVPVSPLNCNVHRSYSRNYRVNPTTNMEYVASLSSPSSLIAKTPVLTASNEQSCQWFKTIEPRERIA